MTTLRLYKALAQAEIEAVVADFYGNQARIRGCQLLKGGVFNTTYHLTTDSDRQGIVLRVAPVNQHLLFDFERSMMSAEPLFFRMLQHGDIPTSQVLHYDDSCQVIDREYIIFRYIPSLPLNDPAVPVGARPGLYQQVGQIIARIHAIQGDQFGWLRPDSRQELFNTWGGFLKRYAREIADRAADHGALSEAELAAFLQVFQDPTAFNQITQARMVHTDLWDGNVLVRERNGEWEVAAIIDVDRSIFGDPVMDFAAPWSENGDFLQGYGSRPPDSAAARFRSAAYTLMGSFMYAYVWLAQYDDPERYAKAKQRGLQALELLVNS